MGIKKVMTIAGAILSENPVNEDWYQERLAICEGCPLNSKNIASENLDISTKAKNLARPGQPVCTACGCWINDKASVKSEVCGRVKKGKNPLWPALELELDLDRKVTIENLSPKIGVISQSGPIFVVKLNKSEEPVVMFEFLVSNSSGFKFETQRLSCSCLSSTVTQENKNSCKIAAKISIKDFKIGLNERAMEIKYVTRNRQSKSINVKFQYIKE